MKSFFIAIVCTGLYFVSQAQTNLTIRGRVDLLSKSKSMIINSPGGQFTAPINADGSFVIRGNITGAGAGLIKTDSSAGDFIWVQPGEYIINCKEIKKDGIKGYLLRTPKFKGPKDAEISYGYNQHLYSLGGKSREENKKEYSDFSISYIDSIIRNYPGSKALPQIIGSAKPFIGDEATAVFKSLMDEGQKSDIYSNGLDSYFKRKDKIEKDPIFKDFEMKKEDGTLFKLSSLNKKLILIDFWSSDCAPCRRKHLELVDLYAKYASKGLEIVSVSLDYNDKEWRKAMLKDKMSWINVSELLGWKTSLAQEYYVNSLPFSLWLDKDKKILKGDLTEAQIAEILK